MEWVKASKRLPELNKEISFRINERRYAGKMIEQGVFQHNGYACTYGVGSVEWLDESPESSSSPTEDVTRACKQYADANSDSKWNKASELERAFLAGHACKGQQGGIPLSIIEALEKANPYDYEMGKEPRYSAWAKCVSKLRSLLQSQPK